MVGDSSETERAEQNRSDDQSIDATFDVLSDRHRRHILKSVLDHGQEIALSELAENIAARDTGPPRSEVSPRVSENSMEVPEDKVQEFTASLHHVHIPKLADAGVVEYDTDRDIVRPTESTRQIEHILKQTEPLSSG